MKLLRFLVRYSPAMVLWTSLAALVSGACSAGLIALINGALNRRGGPGATMIIAFAALGLGRILSNVAAQLTLSHFSQETTARLRLDLVGRILSVPLRKLEDLGSSKLMVALTEDISEITQATLSVPVFAVNLAVLLGGAVYLACLSFPVFLSMFALGLVGAVTYRLLIRNGFSHLRAAREGQDRLYHHFRTLTEGIKELKLHRSRRQAFMREDVVNAAAACKRHNVAAEVRFIVAQNWNQLLFLGLIGLILFLLPRMQSVSPQAMTGYIIATLYLMGPLAGLLGSLSVFSRAGVSLSKVEQLGLALSAVPADNLSADPGGRPATPFRSLELVGVKHHYHREREDDDFLLGPVDLVLVPGELVFLIGGNGSGKSTLAKVVTGLYPPAEGQILLNGLPIDDHNRDEYRQSFSTVFSDYFLFDRIVGNGGADADQRARTYLEHLHLDHKVEIRDGQFSTTQLSQGQRKRLALLCAYIEDRPFYLFDEWASDQDPLFKKVFYNELLPDLKALGKAVLVISHDDLYFGCADRLIKLDYGRITSDVGDAVGALAQLSARTHRPRGAATFAVAGKPRSAATTMNPTLPATESPLNGPPMPARGTRRRLAPLLILGVAVAALGARARAQTYGFLPLAGNGSVLDHTSGTGTNARLYNPTSAAVDSSGNIYIADGGDHTVRKVSAGGVVTTLAGTSGQPGSSDGSGGAALFLYPFAVAVDASGSVYVADSGNQNIRKITAAGAVTTLAGTVGVVGSTDGTANGALFNAPQGIAVDPSGNVYVSDTNNCTIRKITQAGVVTTVAGAAGQAGAADGAGSAARFNYPIGIASDAAGDIFVADLDNSAIREMTPAGSVSTVAGSLGMSGSIDGQGGSARFSHPSAVALDAAGNIYVADTSNQTVREISAGGNVTTLAGTPGHGGRSDGTGAAASFFYPAGIASTSAGSLYIADTGNHTLRSMASPGVVTTLAGSAGQQGSSDGTGTHATFSYPYGIASNGSGQTYIADSGNNTIRFATASGQVTTLAGTAGVPGSADGSGGAASFDDPTGVAVDGNGNVYVADTGNSTIRKIAPGGAVSTLAGVAGSTGTTDGTGSAARFNAPMGVAVDSLGNVYVADTRNNTLRMITPAGTVSTLAGSGGLTGSGDGTGGSARFNGPYAVTVDGSGNVYVADFFNATIRKVTPSGTVSTVAGTAGSTGFADGAGAAARFNQPYGVAVDGSGNVYVADTYNRAIREISPGGAVSTLNGSQTRFYYPQGIAIDASGTIFVVDGDNQDVSSGGILAAPASGIAVASASVSSGQNASFTVTVTGSPVSYQWQESLDGGSTWSSVGNSGTFGGATTATLTVTAASTSMNGDEFRAQLENLAGSSVSDAATLTVTGTSGGGGPTGSARIINLSIRSFVGTGASAVTVGFVINGTGSKQLLIRADGPTLASFGVSGVLADPQITLFDSSQAVIDSNTVWGGSASLAADFVTLGAFALPAASADSALYLPLAAGSSYTAQVSGVNGETGVALAELYDADSGSPPARLINVSARALSGTGSAVLTAGFVIAGTGTETLLIRGIGPGLAAFGVAGVLAATQITLFDSTGTAMATNAGWGGGSVLTAAFAQVGAFSIAANSEDSAMLVSLPAGVYTVEVVGLNGATGIALVEVYEDN